MCQQCNCPLRRQGQSTRVSQIICRDSRRSHNIGAICLRRGATLCPATLPGRYSRTSYDIYRRLRNGRDGHLDHSETYDIPQNVREYGPCQLVLTQFPASNYDENMYFFEKVEIRNYSINWKFITNYSIDFSGILLVFKNHKKPKTGKLFGSI